MYQFRIGHNSILSTKFLHWTFHMVILLPAMMSTLSTLGTHKIKPWQWKFLLNNSDLSRSKQFCTIPTPFQPLANPTSCITALYVKNKANISARCSLKSGNLWILVCPHNFTPNVWILTTAPSVATAIIILIYLERQHILLK